MEDREYLLHIERAIREILAEIEWEEIYAARNIVVHHYFGVNNEIVWDILLEDIPRLRVAVGALLAPRK